MPTPEIKTPPVTETNEPATVLDSLKEGAQNIAQEIKENPEATRDSLAALAGLTVLYMLSPQQKAEFDEETNEEIDKMKASGGLSEDERRQIEEYEEAIKDDNNLDVKEPPVITTRKMRACNIRGINPKTRKKLRGEGIDLNDEIFKIGSYDVLNEKTMASYDSFKAHMLNTFQPELADNPEQQLNNTVRALSYCAIGIYQILPVHHFKKLGWEIEGEKGLRNIYDFISSEEKQGELNLKILEVMADRLGGDIQAVSAEYYSGRGEAVLKYKRDKAEGKDLSEYEWLERKQSYGYGGILPYAVKAEKYFHDYYGKKVSKVDTGNREQMLALQKAIARKETGGGGKRKKQSSIEIA